ncbi:MAG: Zn-ribbon domain-containing OB-fold protein [Burkholderiales bacterium]|nr:Zn-ribbon domain-containing OB-fold protein [Burkholderiales bacterium]
MATPYQDRKLPDPVLNVGDAHYFEAAGQGKLLLKKCKDCNEVHHFPRGICPFCFSTRVDWVEAKGTGTIYTYSVTRRAGPIAYCIAYVTLDEGISVLTNIVDCDLDTVKIGQKVKLTFKKTENGTAMPMFAPA